jgi:hypothetical protein
MAVQIAVGGVEADESDFRSPGVSRSSGIRPK